MSEIALSMFDLEELSDVSIKSEDSTIFLEGTLNGYSKCPKCNSSHIHRKTKNSRLFSLPPVGMKQTRLQVNLQKQACVSCKHTWWPNIPFVTGKQRMSHSFISYALELLKFGTIKDVSIHLGVNWNTIKGIHKDHLNNLYNKIDLTNVEYVSIDEFAIAKRHKYMTILLDIKSGRILHAVEGRKIKEIEPILQELKKKLLS